jgi:hypothetical protein
MVERDKERELREKSKGKDEWKDATRADVWTTRCKCESARATIRDQDGPDTNEMVTHGKARLEEEKKTSMNRLEEEKKTSMSHAKYKHKDRRAARQD